MLLLVSPAIRAAGRPELDEDDWGPARRRYRELERHLTRRFPVRNHNDFVNVYATYVSPELLAAEALAWATALDRPRAEARARLRRNRRPGRLSFLVEFVNHRWPRLEQDMVALLSRVQLEIDGRFFPVAAVERPFLRRLLRGQARLVHFARPEGELDLPGPSARSIRLWFPGLYHRRARRYPPSTPRISFPPELFGDRWVHDLELSPALAPEAE